MTPSALQLVIAVFLIERRRLFSAPAIGRMLINQYGPVHVVHGRLVPRWRSKLYIANCGVATAWIGVLVSLSVRSVFFSENGRTKI